MGDAVTVRVKLVNMEKKQVALTAKDPNAAPSPRPERSGGGGKLWTDAAALCPISPHARTPPKPHLLNSSPSTAPPKPHPLNRIP